MTRTTTERGPRSGPGAARGCGWRRLLACAALVPLVASCGQGADDAEGAQAQRPQERAIPVSVRTAAPGELRITLRASTNLRARQAVEVIPRQGGLVAEILVEEGARVAEGQTLARLDDEQWRLQAQQAEAQAKAAAEAVVRARALARQELLSTAEVENLVSDSAVARAQEELAHLTVRNARITSPIAGVVTHRYIERGQQITTANPAFAVADVDRLEAIVSIPEREAPRVQVGQEARVLVGDGGEPVAVGRVERIRPVVDPGSGTVQVTVALAAGSGLRAGQFVNVDIVTDVLSERITLPRTTVLVDGASPRVFVIEDGRAVERIVVLGYSRGDEVQIESGIAAGDTVVVVGQDNLRAGSAVRIMEIDGRRVQQ
jgi:membrane fusion protein, multidrug efflux system